MKVSCLPVSLFKEIISGSMSFQDWCLAAKQCGLDGIDISMSFIANHSPVYLESIKQILADEDVQIIMATAYPDFTHPSKIQRDREMAYFVRDIAVCAELKIKYLRVLAGQAHPETSISDGINLAIENIRNASKTADHFGVQLLYENHSKPSAWKYTDFSYPPDIFLTIVRGIWDTSTGINFDTGNFIAFGCDPLPILEKVLPKIETIHISDMKEYGTFSPVLIGTGIVPLKPIFQLLKENNFDKWFCIEEASFSGLQGIQLAVQATRKIWEEATGGVQVEHKP